MLPGCAPLSYITALIEVTVHACNNNSQFACDNSRRNIFFSGLHGVLLGLQNCVALLQARPRT